MTDIDVESGDVLLFRGKAYVASRGADGGLLAEQVEYRKPTLADLRKGTIECEFRSRATGAVWEWGVLSAIHAGETEAPYFIDEYGWAPECRIRQCAPFQVEKKWTLAEGKLFLDPWSVGIVHHNNRGFMLNCHNQVSGVNVGATDLREAISWVEDQV